jgi:rfaE bifunctional protein nucleotidyltransferase chain/domain
MNLEDKICSPEDLASRLESLPRPLVMTNGVFDVLHRGHVSYLRGAAELGATLLVAVNSDSSARMLGKGPGRPLNSAIDRAYVLAGLESIDVLTLFDGRTPVELINSIRPDVYVKGGDYDMEALEETKIVRRWGGKSVAIPFVKGFSTTALVDRIRLTGAPLRKAVFLDRDGVINRDKAYVHRWEDFEFLPGAISGMRTFQDLGYALVIVTNQSGLARGYYTEAQYNTLNDFMRQHLAGHGVMIDGVYHCPHHPKGSIPALAVDCDCRKPKPGLLLQAVRDLGIALSNSILIGDKASDIEAARAAGVGRAYTVKSDSCEAETHVEGADGHFACLLDCATHLLDTDKKPST